MSTTNTSAPFQTNVVVGTTAMIGVVAANPTRSGLVIANDAPTSGSSPASVINVTFGEVNTAMVNPPNMPSETTGIPIAAGQTFTLMPGREDTNVGAQLNMIASEADTPVSIFEF